MRPARVVDEARKLEQARMGITDSAKELAATAVAVPTKSVIGFWRGLAYPFRGLRLVFWRHPRLIRFWGPPILIVLALLGVVLVGGWELEDDVVEWIWAAPTGDGVAAWLLGALRWLLRGLVLLLLWAVGTLVVVLVSNVIASPFNDLLSEEVERVVTGRPGPPFALATVLRDAGRTVLLELFKLLIYGVVMVPMFALSFVPVVGPILYGVAGFFFTAVYFAVDYIDWPASRRNRDVHHRFGLVQKHFLPMLGFGTGVWLFLFVPLVNLFFMPAAVAGGTLLFLDLEAGRLSPPPRGLEPGRPAGPESSDAV